MKPNFALSLSHEGIRLLLRAAGGWRTVGTVPTTTENLNGDLAALRQKAEALRPGAVHTKVIVPDDQIRYLSIPTGALDLDARRAAARTALKGATPYAIDDLAFDICPDGDTTHVAAVARETLTEAEAFATEHDFEPVSFVAAPTDQGFLGEPFFGPSNHASAILGEDHAVEPDGVRVVVVGTVDEVADGPETPEAPAQGAPLSAGRKDYAPAGSVPEDAGEEPDLPVREEVSESEDVAPLPEVRHADEDPAEAVPADTGDAAAQGEDVAPPVESEASSPAAEAPDDGTPPVDVPLVRFARAARGEEPEDAPDAPSAVEALTARGTAPVPDAARDAPAGVQAEEARPGDAPAPADTPPRRRIEFEADGDPAPEPGFASRRQGERRSLGGVTRSAPPVPRRGETAAPVADRTVPPFSAPPPESTAPPGIAPQAMSESLRRDDTAAPDDPPDAVHGKTPRPRLGGFLSRRKRAPAPVVAVPAHTPAAAAATAPAPKRGFPTDNEAQRMTVFGARSEPVGGKPRYLGLVLTALLLLFLAGVAAWASVFLDDRLANLFPTRERTLASTLPDDADAELARDVGVTTRTEPVEESAEGVAVAALNENLAEEGLSEEDAAVLDALRDPLPQPQPPEELDAAALDARYAVTGIWPRAPEGPEPPGLVALEDLYVTGIDPISPALDAVALPGAEGYLTDVALPEVSNPAAPGTDFSRDDAGRILPTVEGALSPDGFTVFRGQPPLVPPPNPRRTGDGTDETPEADPAADAARDALAGVRPRARPGDLAENAERASLGGLLRSELAEYRPRLRPRAPQEEAAPEPAEEAVAPAEAAPDPNAPVVYLPTDPLLRPATRPRNFDRTVARAQRQQQRQEAAAPAPRTASVAPATVQPNIPTSTSVAREATVSNAINLRRVNLIGVYGTPSNRRALIRLPNGRYQKVQVGDRFDGGRVSAIGDNELRYQKGGRNLVLKMPSG